jgi:hypothetical protein
VSRSASEILTLYDAEYRKFRQSGFGPTKFEDTAQGIRGLGETQHEFSNFFELKVPSASIELIKTEIAYFTELRRSFSWYIRSDLNPPNLMPSLVSLGLREKESGSFMAFDLSDPLPLTPPAQAEPFVRELEVDEIPAMMEVQAQVWKDHFDAKAFGETLRSRKLADPSCLRLFGAYASNKLVACAWMKTRAGSSFVHLNGGTTLSEFRSRGIYTSLLSARAALAREMGKRFLMIEAGPMSRPIVENRGFQRLCDVFTYIYLVPTA